MNFAIILMLITFIFNANHIHFYGFYIGNYPELESEKILELCSTLNQLQ